MSESLHQFTPSLTAVDPRGLVVRTVAYHRAAPDEAITARISRQVFNANAQLIQQWDPRLLLLHATDASVAPNQKTLFSLSGRPLSFVSVDAGPRISFKGGAGQLLGGWDGRGTYQRRQYDMLLRPVAVFEQVPEHTIEQCVERFVYAGSDPQDARHNRCGRLIRHDDPAGTLWYGAFALSGQTLSETRRFCDLLTPPNWPESDVAHEALLETQSYTSHWRYDALGKLVEKTDAAGHVQRFEHDMTGLIHEASLDGVALLKSCRYNASDQVEVEQAGNGVITTAHYSPADGTLRNLTARSSTGKLLQDLHYQYDRVGNIERIEDLAQPVQWFSGQRIDAVSTYLYDTLYQVISATGRENASHSIGPALPGLATFGAVDDSRWRTYTQHFTYDSGGNLTRLKHDAGAGATYSREMVVAEYSNRGLSKNDTSADFARGFDGNGNQQVLSASSLMHWNARNQLRQVTQVLRDGPDEHDDDNETYVYDGDGQRVRKVRQSKTRSGQHVSEVRYLPGLEIRTRTSAEQLHVVIAHAGRNSVSTLYWGTGAAGLDHNQLRYSLSDHLGSHSLTLDKNAELIAQESYYPYGGTAWWAARNKVEAKHQWVRYSNKERDATGLYYYGFRYYAPWLNRWISPDPAGDIDGLNLYTMVSNNPLNNADTLGLRPPLTKAEAREISIHTVMDTLDQLPEYLRTIEYLPDAEHFGTATNALNMQIVGADNLIKRALGEQWAPDLLDIAKAQAAAHFLQKRSGTVFNHHGVVIKSLLQGATQAVLFAHGGLSPHRKRFREPVTVPPGKMINYYSQHFEDTRLGFGIDLLQADYRGQAHSAPTPKEIVRATEQTKNYGLSHASEGFLFTPTKNYDVIFIEPESITSYDDRQARGSLPRVFDAIKAYRPQIEQVHAIFCRAVFDRQRQRVYK